MKNLCKKYIERKMNIYNIEMPSERQIVIGIATLMMTYSITTVINTLENLERHSEIKNDMNKILSTVEKIKK